MNRNLQMTWGGVSGAEEIQQGISHWETEGRVGSFCFRWLKPTGTEIQGVAVLPLFGDVYPSSLFFFFFEQNTSFELANLALDDSSSCARRK